MFMTTSIKNIISGLLLVNLLAVVLVVIIIYQSPGVS
jgi:hypothetical protein